MKETISIQEIFQTIKKRFILIFLLTLIAVSAAAVLSYYVLVPQYQSSSQFIVVQKQVEEIPYTLNDLNSNEQLMNTYKEIIKSPLILEKVIANLNLDTTPDQLTKQVEVRSSENSRVVTVSALSEQPEAAVTLANTVVNEFKTAIPTILSVDNVHILSKANISREPVKPRPLINMIVAGMIGLATGVGLAIMMEFLNTKVKTERDIEQCGVPVLGTVSKFENDPNRKKKKKKKAKQKNIEHLQRGDGAFDT
ncbi:capsular biosynthesis protein [Filobacillus milosensis]|uniref:Capsular biosynthesis protein n=1 Tax=Filobacillus milosensis TaxID=94137 RepID=A0A4Y8IFC6_9BACI|nr:Wzz/FepE/Etk N-terminal domain-containing protein [Filobacillus milosensis]TFB18909.1 capsular biosynthesis protein [Filobacillus milosensis]